MDNNINTGTIEQKFARIGLISKKIFSVGKELFFEKPISIDYLQASGINNIGAFSYIIGFFASSNVTIGRFCSIGDSVIIGPGEHPTDRLSTNPIFNGWFGFKSPFDHFEEYKALANNGGGDFLFNQPVEIGNDVWIGTRALIKSGIKVGDGAIIASGSVVTKSVEPYSIVGGTPATIIRKRFSDDLIEKFIKLQWWNYDLSTVKNTILFNKPEIAVIQIEEMLGKKMLNLFKTEKYVVSFDKISRNFNIRKIDY